MRRIAFLAAIACGGDAGRMFWCRIGETRGEEASGRPLAYGRSRMTHRMLKTALPGLVFVDTFAQVARPAGERP